MLTQWAALRENFVRSITNLKADREFKEAGKEEATLARFSSPLALVAYLATKGGDLDEKDRVYQALVRAVQAGREWSHLAVALLWLGLWPGLDATYRYRLQDYVKRQDELVEAISFQFSTMVQRIDLSRVNRLAATLVLNIRRQLLEGLKREWRDKSLFVDPPRHEEPLEPDPHDDLGDDPSKTVKVLPAGSGSIASLRERLARIAGRDADLVIGVVLYGFDQREIADRLGISHQAARKRYQRALKRIGDSFERGTSPVPFGLSGPRLLDERQGKGTDEGPHRSCQRDGVPPQARLVAREN